MPRSTSPHLRTTLAVLLGLGLFAACGPGLPSTVPLGGKEDPPPIEKTRTPQPDVASAEEESGEESEVTDDADADSDADQDASDAGDADQDASDASDATDAKAEPPPCSDAFKGKEPECDSFLGGECLPAFAACTMAKEALKPIVTHELVDCMADGEDECDPDMFKACILRAIKKTCEEPGTRPLCTDYKKRCRSEDREFAEFTEEGNCAAALSSLQAGPRKKMMECMKRRCGLEECLEEAAPIP
jgi:hypothetical protein